MAETDQPEPGMPDIRISTEYYNLYYHAYSEMQKFMENHPPARRTIEQTLKLNNLEEVCILAKLKWENSQGRI